MLLRRQTDGSLRGEEASILAELASLNDAPAPLGAAAAAAAAEPGDGQLERDRPPPPPTSPPAGGAHHRVAAPPRGFGIGTGQVLWGNSGGAGWREGTSGGADADSGGADGLAHHDVNPLADASSLTAL